MRLLGFILLFSSIACSAQYPQLLVEKYYIADTLDATDTSGGGIAAGATTYRVFVVLPATSELLAIYGDTLHPFEISSTEAFFNNSEGATFGYQIPKVAYEANTVALDSYLTLGQVGFQGALKFFGVPKYRDVNGSFIGGVNNDGGSEMVPSGLLTNDTLEAGLPLTLADGMDTSSMTINNWFHYGVLDFQSGADSSIFGFGNNRLDFSSQNFTLSNSGVRSLRQDTSHVLVAQLTTTGDLQLKLNLMVREWIDSTEIIRNYVSTNQINSPNETFSADLNYPPQCGCQDPNYLEYSADFVCSEASTCITPIVLGCTDSLACNYNPEANVNLDNVCCYPGKCFGRDIEEVCPQLKGSSFDIHVYPNPSDGNTSVQIISGVQTNLWIEVISQNGVSLLNRTVTNAPLNYVLDLEANEVPAGVYLVRVTTDFGVQHKLLIRL